MEVVVVTINKGEDLLLQFWLRGKPWDKPQNVPKWIREPNEEEKELDFDFEVVLADRHAVRPEQMPTKLIAAGMRLCDVVMVPRVSLVRQITEPLPGDAEKNPVQLRFVFRYNTDGVHPDRLMVLAEHALLLLQTYAGKRWGCGKINRMKPSTDKPFLKADFREELLQAPAIELKVDDPVADAWGIKVTKAGKKPKPQ